MSKFFKIFLIVVILALVISQFFGPERPEVRESNPADLMAVLEVDTEVAEILHEACYDCHSMETKYPWYASVAPVSRFIYPHIEEGRDELNFSEWGEMEKRTKIRKLKEVAEEVEEGKMPLESYTVIHTDAKLTAEQKEKLADWANQLAKQTLRE